MCPYCMSVCFWGGAEVVEVAPILMSQDKKEVTSAKFKVETSHVGLGGGTEGG